MNKLIIIGAGGHGKVIADNALKNGYTDISFIDDSVTGDVMGFPVVGTGSEIDRFNDADTDFIIGIGSNAVRKAIAKEHQLNWVSIIHPSAQIAFNAKIGKGTAVMANAVINACASVGEHCIINTAAVIEHDNVIEDYAHISPNAALGGTVRIGELTHIGIGATVKNNINIYSECIVGAGAVVVKDINEPGVHIGVPAIKK